MNLLARTFLICSALLFAAGCGPDTSDSPDASTSTPGGDSDALSSPGGGVSQGGSDSPTVAGETEANRVNPLKSDKVLRLRKFKVMDPTGFERPVVAATLLAPADWTLEGGVEWNTGNPNESFRVRFVLRSPDGQFALEAFPAYSWKYTRDRMFEQSTRQAVGDFGPGMDARQLIERYLAPTYRRAARVVSSESLAGAAKATYDKAAAVFRPMLLDGSMRLQADAGRAVIEYERDGKSYEEWITSAVVEAIDLTIMSTEAMARGQMVQEPMHYYNAFNLVGFRAPKGQLKQNERLFTTMTASVRINRAWEQAIQRHQQAMHNIAMKGIRDRAAITRQTNQEISAMLSDSWEKQQASRDSVAAAFSRSIRDVGAYVDPSTQETVELSTGYENAWSNGLGEYILSEEVGFDPNPHSSQTWKRLERND